MPRKPQMPDNTEERLQFLEKKIKKLQKMQDTEPHKKKKLTEHNLFMRKTLPKIKQQHPDFDQKQVFAFANQLWKHERDTQTTKSKKTPTKVKVTTTKSKPKPRQITPDSFGDNDSLPELYSHPRKSRPKFF
jgi:hypothetical protein